MSFVTQILSTYEVVAEGSVAEKTAKDIEAAFKAVFPKSLVKATFKTNLGAVITVVFSLVDDKSKLPSGIADNDPAYSVWQLWGFDKDGSAKGPIEAKLGRGGVFMTAADPGTNMAMKSHKLGWRNKTGTPEQIVKHFGDFAKKAKPVMQANVDNAYGGEKQAAVYRSYL